MIKVITEEDKWRATMVNFQHDWYHTWDCHHMAQQNGEGKPVLLVFNAADVDVCFPLLIRDIDKQYSDATSVYGYPGIVATGEITEEVTANFLQALKLWCKDQKIVSVFSRLNSYLDGKHSAFAQIAQTHGETVAVDLTISLDQQRKNYRKNYRNLVNRLTKDGFSCSWSNTPEDLDDFIQIYESTMDSLGAKESYFFDRHYYKSLLNAQDFQTRIYNCYYQGTKVCSGLFVFCGDIVQYHLSGTVAHYKEYGPTRLMIDTVRQDATSMGCKVLHLGGGTTGTRDSLFNFKYGFSKQAIDFRVLKLIMDKQKYAELSGLSLKEVETNTDDFFPLYRKK